jgi:hypothetical protein
MRNPALTSALALAIGLAAAGFAAAGDAPRDPPAPAAAPAPETGPGGETAAPSPLGARPPADPLARLRISAWGGWASEVLRKDAEGLRGERLSWEDDLGGSPWFAAPRLGAEFRLFRKIYAFVDFSWLRQQGRTEVPAGGLRFDGVAFPAGRSLSSTLRLWWVDLGFLAWGAEDENARAAFALGVRALSQQTVLEAGPRARETCESAFPYLEARGEAAVAPRVTLEGAFRASLFTVSYREVVEREDVVVQWVDEGGGVVGETLQSSSRRRLLKTQFTALLEARGAVRAEVAPSTFLFAGFGFAFLNVERVLGDRKEDLEWRSWTLEVGLEFRF